MELFVSPIFVFLSGGSVFEGLFLLFRAQLGVRLELDQGGFPSFVPSAAPSVFTVSLEKLWG